AMHVPKEALMLTGDEAIVDLQFAVQYHIAYAAKYLFNVKDPDKTVREVAETHIREIVGQRPIDDVLTRARAEVAQETQTLMQKILKSYGAGVQVDEIALQSAQAPDPVRPAFRDVISAREDRARAVNEAQAYSNDILPRARGQAERIQQESQAYQARVVNQAKGSAARFRDVYRKYQDAPQITKKRLYLETMEQVLKDNEKVLVDIPKSGNLLYLPLQKILQHQQAKAQSSNQGKGKGKNAKGDQGSAQKGNSAQRAQQVRKQFEKRLESIRRGKNQ
ncbi:MAG TPA: FtsH protease activity modulator HflK, partial [Gammaproteobacteria bacterium]|nr:FtsH protease activity modulator HflK [Gammaproteobacteria bacterium]